MNEIPPGDQTDYSAKPPMATVIGVLALFHFVCCGLPILLLSGVSLAVLIPSPPVLGLLVFALVAIAFYRLRARGCARTGSCTASEAPKGAACGRGEAG